MHNDSFPLFAHLRPVTRASYLKNKSYKHSNSHGSSRRLSSFSRLFFHLFPSFRIHLRAANHFCSLSDFSATSLFSDLVRTSKDLQGPTTVVTTAGDKVFREKN